MHMGVNLFSNGAITLNFHHKKYNFTSISSVSALSEAAFLSDLSLEVNMDESIKSSLESLPQPLSFSIYLTKVLDSTSEFVINAIQLSICIWV